MSLFEGVFKDPAEANILAMKRELAQRRENWTRSGYLYHGGGDFLLRHGAFYSGRQLPDRYAHLFGEPNACFWNALEVAKAHPELRYCEGVYAAHGAFTPHAWCVAPDGGVVEVTWPTRPEHGSEYGRDVTMKMPLVAAERMAYCGVFFRWELIEWFSETYGELCLLDRAGYDAQEMVERGFDATQTHDNPILKVPFDPDRVTL